MVIRMDIINEVIQKVCDILDVKETIIDIYYIKFGFKFNFTFYYSVNINWVLDLHDLYDWKAIDIANEIVDNIEYEFLNKTIRKKEN